jgi:hypothetical protein
VKRCNQRLIAIGDVLDPMGETTSLERVNRQLGIMWIILHQQNIGSLFPVNAIGSI